MNRVATLVDKFTIIESVREEYFFWSRNKGKLLFPLSLQIKASNDEQNIY